jgi:hypothetical protein
MSFKPSFLVGSLVIVSLATGIAAASAAETGTKTMPDSSIYPPATPAPVFGPSRHQWCYLPTDGCDNQHSEENYLTEHDLRLLAGSPEGGSLSLAGSPEGSV